MVRLNGQLNFKDTPAFTLLYLSYQYQHPSAVNVSAGDLNLDPHT